MPYDLFISYSRKDDGRAQVSQLVERIKSDFAAFASRPLNPFFDKDEIHGMQDWRHRIWQGLRESRLLLACLSPAYLESEYCQWEMVEYLKYEIGHRHGFNGITPIYFVQVPGWDDKDFDRKCADWVAELRRRQHFDLRPWYELGEAALHETAVSERMTKLNRRIVECIQRGERQDRSLGNVDASNPHFIGRTAQLRSIRENFVKPGHVGVVTAVNGMGGLGKTALAIEYAHAYADEYGGGCWQVRCAGRDDLRLALAELATPMGFEFTDEEKASPDQMLERVRRELKQRSEAGDPHRCLLLLDNVDRPAILAPITVARLNGGDWLHILATTRLGEDELFGSHRDRTFLAVDELPPDDALALIQSYQPEGLFLSDEEREAAREIVRLLGCFTLAIESVAVYLGQYANDVTCAGFLARLKKEGLEGLDRASTESAESVLHGEKSMSATLRPTLERLKPTQRLLLEYAALLPPDQVPLPWLRALVGKDHPELLNDAEPGYPDPWKSLLRGLFGQRLLQVTDAFDEQGQPRVVRVHRLVQEIVLAGCAEEERTGRRRAGDALIKERVEELDQAKEWEGVRWELDPLTALANLWNELRHPKSTWLMNEIGQYFFALAEWGRAEQLMRCALEIDEKLYGFEHPSVAIDLNNLATLLTKTNRLTEAEQLMRSVSSIFEKCYGDDNPIFAIALNNLAQLLTETNRLAEAEQLMRRALKIDERSLGEDHPTVAARLNNLAQVLKDANRLEEAEPLLRRAVYIYKNCLGEEHPDFGVALNNLALLLMDTNQLDDAEPFMRRALEIAEKHYGPAHPSVANCLSNLASLLCHTNRLAEAEPMMRRALEIDEKSYGGNHPTVAIRLNNLSTLLQNMSRPLEAEPFLRRSLGILFEFTRTTGHLHANAQALVDVYANLLQELGSSEEQIQTTLREMAPDHFSEK